MAERKKAGGDWVYSIIGWMILIFCLGYIFPGNKIELISRGKRSPIPISSPNSYQPIPGAIGPRGLSGSYTPGFGQSRIGFTGNALTTQPTTSRPMSIPSLIPSLTPTTSLIKQMMSQPPVSNSITERVAP